jgi:tetratricopeptide (TPR) repeat protein
VIRSDDDWVAARDRQAAEASRERARAEKLWQRLQASGDRKAWKDLILGDPEFQSWALCEKLCHESAELAEDDAGGALELVELALELAPEVCGDEKTRCCVLLSAWQHLGNVWRVRGELRRAEEAFKQAEEYLAGATAGILPSLIQHDRHAALEAALHRDQGHLVEALRKIDHAAFSPLGDPAYKPVLFLEKARLHRQLDQPKEALQALSSVDRRALGAGARLLVSLEIERGEALCDLGRHGEVKQLPAGLRKVAESFPRERFRLLCLEGRAASGRGRLEEASAALQKAHAALHDRAVAYLVRLSFEVGALYARQGRTAELKELAEQTLRLAENPGLGREAAATLKLWCRLAAQEKLSFERATQFVRDF